jgi:hypothetical protein
MALTDSLISYWKLDEASGNALDAHGSHELTATNAPGTVTGKINDGRDLAVTKYFVKGYAAELDFDDEDFTVAGWVKLTSKPGLGFMLNMFSGTAGYSLSYNSGVDRFRFQVGDNDTSHAEDADNLGSPSTATWYYIVAWHDSTANTVNIQVNNGTVDSGGYSAGVDTPGADFQIGFSGNGIDGVVDEFALWNRTLTTQERTDLYNGGSGLAYSAFNDDETEALTGSAVTTVQTAPSPSHTIAL